ncbi:MAG: DUF4298 domain-containing protein [Oscillospiraceae bacterium]|nr:DUF4298 domain-containing protein [Oscillospiraceae bacterium]
MQTIESIIERIIRMEQYYDTLLSAIKENPIPDTPALRSAADALNDYLNSGRWLADYEADERGRLPRNLKRGVLSQDGLYNLLHDFQNRKEEVSMIKGIHHISMKTQNEEEYRKARHFYTETLGLAVIKECDACILLDTGAGVVEIFRNATEALPQGVIRHFAFTVDDVQACTDAVEAAGYEVFIRPKTVQIGGDPAFPASIAFCRGPLGEEIEFFSQGW